MKNIVLAAASALLTSVIVPSAHATQYQTITGPSGTFGDDSVLCAAGVVAPCSFSSTFQFVTPIGFNLSSATISSVIAGNNQATNIDFTSVTLNGVEFNNIVSDGSEFRNIFNQPLVANALNTLLVSGTTGGDGSFSGVLAFAAVVPEPATWATMMLGMGVMGAAMRRRRKVATRISYAI